MAQTIILLVAKQKMLDLDFFAVVEKWLHYQNNITGAILLLFCVSVHVCMFLCLSTCACVCVCVWHSLKMFFIYLHVLDCRKNKNKNNQSVCSCPFNFSWVRSLNNYMFIFVDLIKFWDVCVYLRKTFSVLTQIGEYLNTSLQGMPAKTLSFLPCKRRQFWQAYSTCPCMSKVPQNTDLGA